MAQIKSGATADLLTVGPTFKEGRFSARPIEGGRYRLGFQSGLITAVAAASATAGHLFAFRWGSGAGVGLIHRVTARWVTIAGFTAAQEIGLDLIRATGYSASHAGGSPATLTGVNLKRRQSMAASMLTDARGPTTGALTAGTHTLDAQAMAFDSFAELAAGATVGKGRMLLDMETHVNTGGPMELATNEGFIVRNLIAMGAGGTARLSVEVDWSEVGLGAGW